MTKRIPRLELRSTLPLPAIAITPSGVTGRFRPERSGITQVVLTVDGVPYSAAPTRPVGDGELLFELPVPSALLGGALDVLAADTGRSVLETDLDLGASRGLQWLGWSMRGRRIKGSFRFDGPAAPAGDLAIPVEFLCGMDVFGRCFAVPEPEEGGGHMYRFSGEITRLPPQSESVE